MAETIRLYGLLQLLAEAKSLVIIVGATQILINYRFCLRVAVVYL